jgi:hypothetical protein
MARLKNLSVNGTPREYSRWQVFQRSRYVSPCFASLTVMYGGFPTTT